MARLFITPREIAFISDVTKEVMKDVIGQKVYYYSISEVKTNVHDVYNEAPEKIFENPLELDALVQYQAENIITNIFGSDRVFDIQVWVHHRDLIDKGIELSEGDFFSFGEVFFEVVKFTSTDIVYGQTENLVGWLLDGKESRKSQFVSKVFGPTDRVYTDPDAIQDPFVQQRGLADNKLGSTGDVRELQRKGVLTEPISGPAEVSHLGKRVTESNADSAFYGDDE